MDLVNQFIENYRKKYTFYENAGRLAAKQLETALQSAGIRAIVTSRAKNPGRLKYKTFHRNAERETPYKNMREIYDDMFDLAGVRVSLYFPGDRDKADALISDLFTVMEKKQFPEQSKTPTYNKRFPGIGPTITGCISVRRTYRPTRKSMSRPALKSRWRPSLCTPGPRWSMT